MLASEAIQKLIDSDIAWEDSWRDYESCVSVDHGLYKALEAAEQAEAASQPTELQQKWRRLETIIANRP